MFNLRLKQAETALRDGRLDEAASLAVEPVVREHRDGQVLITKLVTALLDRATEHLAADCCSAAQQDLGIARQLGGNAARIAELQAKLDLIIATDDRQRRRERVLLSEAQREVDAGNCELGEQLLQRAASDDSAADRLSDQLAAKRSRIDAAAERAAQLVESGRTNDAVSAIAELHSLNPKHESLSSLVDQVTGPVVDQLLSEINAGRLDRVQALTERVRPLVPLDPGLEEFDQIVSLGRVASQAIKQSRFDNALRTIRQLRTLLPEAEWLKTLQENTQQAAELTGELQASPLSLLADASRGGQTSPDIPGPHIEVRSIERRPGAAEQQHSARSQATSDQLLLQIDGAGSALLLTSSSLSIGNASRAGHCDLPLTGYSGDAPALLTRHGGDYQVLAGGECWIDGVKCREKLLPADAKLAFGPRCRLRFRRPTSVSHSASIDLTGTRLSRSDIRTVVLFDETLIAGAARTSHVVNRSLEQPLVLFQRDGRFFARNGFAARQAGRDPIAPIPVEPGESVDVGGVRLRLSSIEL
ncbi:hypothetical protein GC176_22885 [bacterium]|nr:hypothetical protein [bacterium]